MPLQTTCNFPIRKRIAENCKPTIKERSVKRALFGSNSPPVKKIKVCDENQIAELKSANGESFEQDSFGVVSVKQALHTGMPSNLIGRSEEISEITCFLNEHIRCRRAGSMYISGAPGTGKTSSLMHVIKNIKEKFSYAFINCMSLSNPAGIYKSIAKELKLQSKVINSKNVKTFLEQHILASKTMTVLILDEIDHLDNKGQEVLYTLFEWPQLPNSSLILIGVANALDLTDRVLPRLHAFNYQPVLKHFQPYTKDQIISILESRLAAYHSNGKCIITPTAIQLCARKIAANTGDIRKALDVCRRALELVENREKKKFALQPTSDDRCNPGSPMKKVLSNKCVDIQDISAVLHEVYGSRLQTSHLFDASQTVTMPLQHMILLCTLILLKKHCKIQDMTVGKVYGVYRRVCKKRNISEVEECAFHGLCRLVESRGFLQLQTAKIPRMTKVVLKIDEKEAEYVLQDKAMLPAILADPSVLKN